MPIVTISILEGRDDRAKAKMISAVTDAIEESLGAERQTIRVLINELPPSHWGTGGVPKSAKSEGK